MFNQIRMIIIYKFKIKENKKWMILKSNHIIKKYKKNIIKKIYNLKIKKRLIFLKLWIKILKILKINQVIINNIR